MKKAQEDAFCPDCEWTGDATGLTSCPVCGSDLSRLDSFDELPQIQERYPSELLESTKETDDEFAD